MPSFFQDPVDRKWMLLLLVITLLFALLIWCIWLYYSYYVKKLDYQKVVFQLWPDPIPLKSMYPFLGIYR